MRRLPPGCGRSPPTGSCVTASGPKHAFSRCPGAVSDFWRRVPTALHGRATRFLRIRSGDAYFSSAFTASSVSCTCLFGLRLE